MTCARCSRARALAPGRSRCRPTRPASPGSRAPARRGSGQRHCEAGKAGRSNLRPRVRRMRKEMNPFAASTLGLAEGETRGLVMTQSAVARVDRYASRASEQMTEEVSDRMLRLIEGILQVLAQPYEANSQDVADRRELVQIDGEVQFQLEAADFGADKQIETDAQLAVLDTDVRS